MKSRIVMMLMVAAMLAGTGRNALAQEAPWRVLLDRWGYDAFVSVGTADRKSTRLNSSHT